MNSCVQKLLWCKIKCISQRWKPWRLTQTVEWTPSGNYRSYLAPHRATSQICFAFPLDDWLFINLPVIFEVQISFTLCRLLNCVTLLSIMLYRTHVLLSISPQETNMHLHINKLCLITRCTYIRILNIRTQPRVAKHGQ